jgi:hypothetical protein
MDSISSRSLVFWVVALGVVVLVIRYAPRWSRGRDDFPRIGPEPTSPDNRKYQTESSKMIEEGYAKVRFFKSNIEKLSLKENSAETPCINCGLSIWIV